MSAKKLSGSKLPFPQSIAIQVLIPMAVIGLLALSSMLVSVLVTMNTRNDAEALNIAGSMRMQSYRMAVALQDITMGKGDIQQYLAAEVALFNQKLHHPSIAHVAQKGRGTPLARTFDNVVDNWEKRILPGLQPAIAGSVLSAAQLMEISREYRGQVDAHVGDIDALVLQIQQNTEDKIELLSMYEGLSIFLSFMAIFYIVMRADQKLVRPLTDLVRAAEHIGAGDFSYRTYYEASNEIGLLCRTFNQMSASLSRHYRKLEDLVDEKTAQLKRSNQVLDFLYGTSRRLSERAVSNDFLADILAGLKKITGVPQLSLCLASEPNTDGKFDLVLPRGEQHPCRLGDCVNCFMRRGGNGAQWNEMTFPIVDQQDTFGFLYLKLNPGTRLESWQARLAEAVVEQLSAAVALQYREGQRRRLMLFEERSTIARELHDSLAQSLSYMKMQVARTARLFELKASDETLRESIEDLQQGLNAAYRHLRELLATFRLKLDAPTLLYALQSTVDELKRQHPDITIRLDYALGHCPLTPNEDIHVLQIIREALTNAVKHAHAKKIELRCFQGETGRGNSRQALFTVTDNGIGMAEVSEKEHHYGLSTMRERASLLDGEITIDSTVNCGTSVQLAFVPEFATVTNEAVNAPRE